MFNYKKFLRSVPATLLKDYLDAREFPMPADFDWEQPEDKLVKSMGKIIDAAEDAHRSNLIADLLEASALASEGGSRAMLNALEEGDESIMTLSQMDSDEQRALWVYWKQEVLFDRAMELLFFDDRSRKQATKRIRLPAGVPMSLDQADVDALKTDVAAFYRKKEGCGNACDIEITPRRQEGSTQLTVYVEGLTSSRAEFNGGRVHHRRSRPAMELALVYHPDKGIIETAVRGGKRYHQMLQERFTERLLKSDADPEWLLPEKFKLQNLKYGVSLFDASAYGIDQVQLKKLVLYATDGTGGTLTIEAPSSNAGISAEQLAEIWFSERNPVHARFVIVQAAIAIHLIPPEQGREPTPIQVEFRRDGTINWGKITEQQRAMVEELLVEWGLVDTAV